MKMRICYSLNFVAFLFLNTCLFAQKSTTLLGTIVDKNSQQPIVAVSLMLQPSGKAAISDSAGKFSMNGIAPGTYTLQITAIGFAPKTLANLVLSSGNQMVINIEMEATVQQLENVVVSGRKNSVKATSIESPLSVQRLTTEEIKANPGGNFDISKVIQSLPGVGGGAGGGGFRNDIVIRGGAPSENVYYLDGIEVPVINHFSTQGSGGGPQGILNVSFIEDVKLSSSAFDARYDNALSSVFQFRQKTGNPNHLQGNVRLSGTEVAATLDGPMSKNTSFLASVRRSYLQFLFKAIDLPIRPNYWDYQFKTTTRLSKKTTLNFLGIGAIDDFSFALPRNATPEKLYAISSSPFINQWNYTIGASLKHLMANGYWNLAISRNSLNNEVDKFENNQNPLENERTLKAISRETENKLRFDVTQNFGALKLSYGAMMQYIEFDNDFYQRFRPELKDDQGNVIQAPVIFTSTSDLNFLKYGGFVQAGTRMLQNRLAISAGLRIDGNSHAQSVANPLEQLSPRISVSYALSNKWNASASYGIYYKLPAYAQIAFENALSSSIFKNPAQYIRSSHVVAGFEYLPSQATRFTIEGFYKKYSNYPVSIWDGISLANKGTEFTPIGNEPVTQEGKGRAFGFEFFAQQKLTRRFFGVMSYTFYRSEFTGSLGNYAAATWDNKHLLSLTGGYKMGRNWELGVKFRFQGKAPFTPYDMLESQRNFLTLGSGIFNYALVNTQRLKPFHAGDLRIDKKWNFKKISVDLYLDIQNWYASKTAGIPQYMFQRNADNTAFVTTDGQNIKQDGSNAIPLILSNEDGNVLPTIGFIVEF